MSGLGFGQGRHGHTVDSHGVVLVAKCIFAGSRYGLFALLLALGFVIGIIVATERMGSD
jgi:hypothetical protein